MHHKNAVRLLWTITAAVVAINVVVLINARALEKMEHSALLRPLLAPSFFVKKTIIRIEDFITKYSSLAAAYDEKEYLRKRHDVLSVQHELLKKKAAELERLLGLEHNRKKYPFPITVTRVIGRTPMFWHQFLIVDGGRDKGFEPGMPVITKDGLVGRLTEVYDDSSKMLLIIDPDFSVDVRGEKSNVLALCSGIGTSVMKINYLPRFEDLHAGEVMMTSGLDGGFPEGIPVGYVVEINKPFGAYFLDAYVVPVIDVLKISEVMVIKSFTRKK